MIRNTPLEPAGDASLGRLPLFPAAPSASIAAELFALPPDHVLVERVPFRVVLAPASAIPRTLLELGRLRGEVFPDARDGAGVELDRFDATYLHLVLWDDAVEEVAGAYRLGCTDLLGAERAPEVLYGHTLFELGPAFLERLGPAIELGRSFVRPGYQRSLLPLHLLWLGIGRLLAANPRYRRLFGALTIQHDLGAAARDLCLEALHERTAGPEWTSLVRARRPVRVALREGGTSAAPPIDPAELARSFEAVCEDGDRFPVLLRHYARLGARTLGFSRDPRFGGSVDALVLVDLARSPRTLLARYLGPYAAERFLAIHAS